MSDHGKAADHDDSGGPGKPAQEIFNRFSHSAFALSILSDMAMASPTQLGGAELHGSLLSGIRAPSFRRMADMRFRRSQSLQTFFFDGR
jgi:hypothetical protein